MKAVTGESFAFYDKLKNKRKREAIGEGSACIHLCGSHNGFDPDLDCEVVAVKFVKSLYRVLYGTALQRLHRFPLASSRIRGNLIHAFFPLPAALGFTVLLFITSLIISNVAYRYALE